MSTRRSDDGNYIHVASTQAGIAQKCRSPCGPPESESSSMRPKSAKGQFLKEEDLNSSMDSRRHGQSRVHHGLHGLLRRLLVTLSGLPALQLLDEVRLRRFQAQRSEERRVGKSVDLG